MIRFTTGVLFLVALSILVVSDAGNIIKLPSEFTEGGSDDEAIGTRWAVLIAGSKGWVNYHHQADVCHAYQILKKGGLKDENIIVFMYDDIAYNESNPRPGIIINSPDGNDVYAGVPKDYTGEDITAHNFFAVLLANKSALTGGSGKVLDSGPNDHIFVYYTDHGAAGVVGMPSKPYMYADDLIEVLKKKHASGTYKKLVFYLEACDAGSMFEGLLPEGLNIYAVTASGADDGSWITYCPVQEPRLPPGYDVCLGDLWSVTWLVDSEVHNLHTETLGQQYHSVKKKIAYASTAMEYGSLNLASDELYLYMGTNPANGNNTFMDNDSLYLPSRGVNQRDADLMHLWHKYRMAPVGSETKFEAQKQLAEARSHRMHLDNVMKLIGELLFGTEEGPEVMNAARPPGQPVVDDWDCYKSLVEAFETRCGTLSDYGMKYMRRFANMCNAGIKKEQLAEAADQTCANNSM